MGNVEPYLKLGDVEVVNDLRSLTYLRRGLGAAPVDVTLVSPLTPELGYSDVYDDAYHADPFWPGNLPCYCVLLDHGPYVSPSVDPAPWYDPSRPESDDFLGIVVDDIEVREILARAVTPRSAGGGTVGPQTLRPRVVALTGVMHAKTTAGMGWGKRWLAQALSGPVLGCDSDELTLVPACPPSDAAEPTSYLRFLEEVGLVDGPTFTPIQNVGSAMAESVTFQLAAGRPHLRSAPIVSLAPTYLRANPAVCCSMAGPHSLGDTAARVTIHAGQVGSTVSGITVTATYDSNCPSGLPADFTYEVQRIPPGCALVIDGSTSRVTVTSTLTGDVVGGPDSLGFSGLLTFPVAAPGHSLCVCIDATGAQLNAGTLAIVEAIGREL